MTNKASINLLKDKIYGSLAPLIGDDVILTDLPYHGNIGDILIWEGELSFLKKIGKFPIKQTSSLTFTFPRLEKKTTVCLHGGGNFGDLYREAQEFRKSVIQEYPDNRIIIFPQSVWYSDPDLIAEDSEVFARHPDLYICARDITGYRFLKKWFSANKILLVPDMAFCIGDLSYRCRNTANKNKSVFIRRLDKEYDDREFPVADSSDVRDWPFFEKKWTALRVFLGVGSRLRRIGCKKARPFFGKCIDSVMNGYFRKRLIAQGISMLSPYSAIYTTRLHGLILGILLDKKTVGFDNITRKLTDFGKTWLADNDSVDLRYTDCK